MLGLPRLDDQRGKKKGKNKGPRGPTGPRKKRFGVQVAMFPVPGIASTASTDAPSSSPQPAVAIATEKTG